MANSSPATVTVTETTGPGLSVTALKQTDINNIEVDFLRNYVKITKSGAGGIQYYDYSALATFTWTISGGVSTLVLST